ncbi:unnamed protein product [marine sediment metagenome]|uniref:Uncharacterized protein n=1 Tax=marine sediment metagenome TaxID=412755 RepID=X1MRV6_9ZZZZ
MVDMVTFDTDAAAVAGRGAETLSLETFFISPGMAILDLFQTPGAVLANDADWQMYIDGLPTRYQWTAEELDPVAMAGGRGRLPSSINISPGRLVQFRWAGQAAAQANRLKVLYERVR